MHSTKPSEFIKFEIDRLGLLELIGTSTRWDLIDALDDEIDEALRIKFKMPLTNDKHPLNRCIKTIRKFIRLCCSELKDYNSWLIENYYETILCLYFLSDFTVPYSSTYKEPYIEIDLSLIHI